MYIIERKTDTDIDGIVGVHNANMTSLDEWDTNDGVEAVEITEKEYNNILEQINQNGMQQPRYKYTNENGFENN